MQRSDTVWQTVRGPDSAKLAKACVSGPQTNSGAKVSNMSNTAKNTASVENTNDIIGYAEAAEVLGVKIGTLYAWTCQRRVPFYRISGRCVRFSRAELLRWLESRAVGVAAEAEQ